jgi:tripartite-type tricarboxylate transporter receptor subunit TctC
MRDDSPARRAVIFSIVAAAAWVPLTPSAQSPSTSSGQAFPNKPVRYVVPFGAGASPDIVGRLLADRFTRLWGQQVIVDNRVGVAGVMGTAFVAKSPPDGHTMVQCNVASSAIAVSLMTKMPYDQLRDLAAVTRIGNMPNIILAHPSMPFRNLKEMIAYARANPGKLSYSSGLPGVSPQLSVEMIKLLAKIDIVNIPYKIAAQGLTDTIGGQVPLNVSNLPASVQPVASGRLRAIAVTSANRTPQMPNVPTVQEAGFPGYEVQSWYGVCVPSGTPTAILDKLNADIHSVLRIPEIQQRLTELGIDIAPTTREEFDQFIRAEIVRWAQVIKDAGIVQQ